MPLFFVAITTWLAKFFGDKALNIAFRLAVIAALVILILSAVNGFMYVIHHSLNSISATVPELISMIWSWIMPSNAKQCIVVIIATRIAKFYFNLSYRLLLTKAKAIFNAY